VNTAVATAIQVAINALADFDATVSSADVTVKQTTPSISGLTDPIRDSATATATGFTFTTLGTGIPDDTCISAILSSTSIQMTNAATVNRTASYVGGAGWRNYSGTYMEPDATLGRIRGVSASQNFYFITSTGVERLDAYNGTPVTAGGIKAIDGDLALSGSSGFMTTNTQVAYRIVWGYKDANNNLHLGAPSQRLVISNASGGSRNVQITIYIPAGVTVNHFYQIYRSGMSASSTSEPNDEMNLVFEDNPLAAEITAQQVVITDNTPESLRAGATLYTSASQEGSLQANEVPPYCKDIAVFRDSTFFANTKTKQRLTLTNLAVGGTTGLNYLSLAATYVNATSFTVVDSTGIAAGMMVTGPAANVPVGITVSSVSGTTINVTGGSLTAWGATKTLQFRDQLSLAGVTYTTNDLGRTTSTVTMTIASPGVITWTANGLTNDSTVKFSTTGALPTGITAGTTYFVVNVAANTFQVSATQGGTAINTSGSQSGVHTAVANDQKFSIVTSGTPAQNINDSIRSLVKTINLTTANTTVYAYYLSNAGDLPGQFLLEERGIGGSVFYATVTSHNTAFNPVLPTSGTTVPSTNDLFKNGLYYSKTLQPEAVPLLNYFRIGSAEKEIYRIIPLRDALFILKEDGIYRLTGFGPSSFRVDLLDNTTKIIAPESAVPLNNQIYMLADQGVVAVSDTGVAIVSRNIEITLLKLFSASLATVKTLTFAIPYETERKYILWTITNAADTYPTQAYVINTFTQAWTRWPLSKKCGIVSPTNGRIYCGDALTNKTNVERKARDFTDYVDDDYQTTLTSASGKTLTVASTSNIEVGDLMYQSSTAVTTVIDLDVLAGTVTVSDTVTWIAPAPITILKAIETIIEYVPETAKNPGITKQYREISFFFKDVFFDNIEIGFTSDLSGSRESVSFSGFGVNLWGLFTWGSGSWGGGQRAISVRTYVPASKQRCSQLTVRLTHREGYSYYSLEGLSLIYNNLSERLRR
jgi:hypothetical protein